MPYCSVDDVQLAAGGSDRLISLSDQSNTGSIDAGVVGSAIAEASTWANGYLRRTYLVPFADDNVPPFVNALVAKETVYVLKQWRQTVTDQDVVLHQERERELKAANMGQIMVQEEEYPVRGGAGTPGAFEPPSQELNRIGVNEAISRETLKGFW